MDIYSQRSSWKVLLAILGTVVLLITLIYSNYLAEELKKSEERNIELYAFALQELFDGLNSGNSDLNKDITFPDSVRNSFPLPIIVEDEMGYLIGNNWPEGKNEDEAFLAKKKKQFLESGKKPIVGQGYSSNLYFFNSQLLDYIKYYPLVQLFMVASFILLGYFIFNTSRKAEQNRVWAGMAKETAHQLGTPISAIIGWIEHLKLMNDGNNEHLEIVEELRNDVNRLELVADRFSKIGSAPVLKTINIYSELNKCKNYMERRSPRRVSFDFPESGDLYVDINEHLFDWVVENLMRNSLDAMDGKGVIAAKVYDTGNTISIDISDTGKGIHSSKFGSVFKPGYSTKLRGWGLGLSLAKRIINDYHKGKIFVKKSKLGEGTTFTIKLPKKVV